MFSCNKNKNIQVIQTSKEKKTIHSKVFFDIYFFPSCFGFSLCLCTSLFPSSCSEFFTVEKIRGRRRPMNKWENAIVNSCSSGFVQMRTHTQTLSISFSFSPEKNVSRPNEHGAKTQNMKLFPLLSFSTWNLAAFLLFMVCASSSPSLSLSLSLSTLSYRRTGWQVLRERITFSCLGAE